MPDRLIAVLHRASRASHLDVVDVYHREIVCRPTSTETAQSCSSKVHPEC